MFQVWDDSLGRFSVYGTNGFFRFRPAQVPCFIGLKCSWDDGTLYSGTLVPSTPTPHHLEQSKDDAG